MYKDTLEERHPQSQGHRAGSGTGIVSVGSSTKFSGRKQNQSKAFQEFSLAGFRLAHGWGKGGGCLEKGLLGDCQQGWGPAAQQPCLWADSLFLSGLHVAG